MEMREIIDKIVRAETTDTRREQQINEAFAEIEEKVAPGSASISALNGRQVGAYTFNATETNEHEEIAYMFTGIEEYMSGEYELEVEVKGRVALSRSDPDWVWTGGANIDIDQIGERQLRHIEGEDRTPMKALKDFFLYFDEAIQDEIDRY